MDQSLSRSVRTLSLFIDQPASERQYWEVSLPGLHPEQLKLAVRNFRESRQKNGDTISQPNLKIKDLLNGLARALGSKSFEQWIHQSQPELEHFMAMHGLREPVDLIKWKKPPFAHPLTARRIADRFFASGLPLPKRLFTGVGNELFVARHLGRLDLKEVLSRITGEHVFTSRSDFDMIRTVLSLPDQKIYPDELFDDEDLELDPDYRGLTLRDLLLLTLRMDIDCAFNLLSDNLVQPKVLEPVYQLYNTSAEDDQRMAAIFDIFRAKIEQASTGWVDVLPFNDNIVFLRGANGAYDWVVRDQRDTLFSGNGLYPVFSADEIPRAMSTDTDTKAKLHFTKGLWREQIEHSAELFYYSTGATAATYPGQDRLLINYFLSLNDLAPRKAQSGARRVDFVAHHLADKCLMVSDLITIDEFWSFYESGWAERRTVKATRTKRSWPPFDEMNGQDERDLPVCATWYDAFAYCKFLESRAGLPVRLLTIEEWQAIAPERAAVEALGSKAMDSVVEGINVDGRMLAPPTYLPHYFTRFTPDLCWIPNEQGLLFLSSLSFGEWLGDYRGSAPNNVYAPVACTASGIALGRGPLETELFEAWYVGRNNHLKVGFRVCYVANHDG